MAKKTTRQPKKDATKAKKPRPKKKTKAEQLTEAEELLVRIEAAEQACVQTQSRMIEIKSEYKEAKEAHGYNLSELRRLCRARKEQLPLFDQPKPAEATQGPAADTKTEAITTDATPATPAPEDDSWKAHAVGACGCTEKQADALEAAGITTLGELQLAMTRHGEYWAKNTGVSQRMRQGIEDAFNGYLMAQATKSAA
jgi:hypothetical protein